MTDQEVLNDDLDKPLEDWRQGDFALDVGGFLFAGLSEDGYKFDAEETTEDIIGLIAISQTGDIVRRTGGRDFIAFCPLTNVTSEMVSHIRRGRRPYFTDVGCTDEKVFADLRRIMSVQKDVVRTWNRQSGFTSETARLRFTAALERKFGQFAFPDEFDQAIKGLRDRVWSRHSRPDSGPGKVYRSLVQIRFRAEPDWQDNNRKITVVAVMHYKHCREVGRNIIYGELEKTLTQV